MVRVAAASMESQPAERGALPLAAQASLLAGPFLSMLDANIVNVALPDITRRLHTVLDTAQWVLSGYLLALAAGLAASAYLAKRFGVRPVYLASLLGFTLASVLCALAPNIGVLIGARALQGALGAALVPVAMSLLLGKGGAGRQIPPAAGILLFLAPALGPSVGGLLINAGGWPLIFLVNVPFGVLGAFGVRRIPEQAADRRDPAVRFDPLGLLLLSVGLVLAIYGATQGPQHGWASRASWPYLGSGVVLLAGYVLWALHRPHPAVDLKLLRHAQTALAVGLCALVAVVMFAVLFLLPVFLEELQGLSPLQAGLTLLPQGLVTGVGTVLGDRIAPRWGVRVSAVLGLVTLTLTTAALLLVTRTTPAWVTALVLSGRGLAVGLTIQPLLIATLGDLTQSETADGNTLFNVVQRLGGSIGINLLATFFAVREQVRVDAVLKALGPYGGATHVGVGAASQLPAPVRVQLAQAAVTGFHDTVWLLVVLSALGLGAALLLRQPPGGMPSRRAGQVADGGVPLGARAQEL
jgi:EmrB/QacA subfamily drug resistance transporter